MNLYKEITKMGIFAVLSMQILLTGIAMPLIMGNNLNVEYSSSEKEQKKDSNNHIPVNEDEAEGQFEVSNFVKVIDQISATHFSFESSASETVKFVLYNSKDKIQFHPEFSTPPPKLLYA